MLLFTPGIQFPDNLLPTLSSLIVCGFFFFFFFRMENLRINLLLFLKHSLTTVTEATQIRFIGSHVEIF